MPKKRALPNAPKKRSLPKAALLNASKTALGPLGDEVRAVGDIRVEVASYIEELTLELRSLARSAGLGSLAYFLDIARLEAANQVEIQSSRPKAN